jgi:peptide/nickel transport system substrate-binding protein
MFRRIGWQVLLVGIGFLVAAVILLYMSETYTTEFRPAPGGTYVEGIGGYPQSLNPLLSFYNDADSDVVSLVFNGLTKLNRYSEVVPDLARDWSIDTTGITYTFNLKSNVLWHDGYYFTAEDVVNTIELLQDPDYPGPPDIGALWRTVDVTPLDDYTVQFVLDEPYAPFLDYTTIGILPHHIFAEVTASSFPGHAFNRAPIGTGPFRVTDVVINEAQITEVTMKRFSRYFGETSYLENIIFKFYPTPRAAFDAYQDGIVEGVSKITLDILPQAFAEENLILYSAPSPEMVMVYFNEIITDTLPFADPAVRRALSISLDRQSIVDEVLIGQAILPKTPLLPGTWAYTEENIPDYSYDPQKASDIFAEAGWYRQDGTGSLRNVDGSVMAFSLMTASESQELAIAEAIATQWQSMGISITVEAVPPPALTGVLDSRTYQSALVRLVLPGDPDPYPFWHETQALPGQGQNYAGYQNRTISEILEQARITVNREERLAYYHEFQRLFMEEVPALPLFVPVYTYALDSRVSGGQIGPLMQSGDRFQTIANWYVLQRRVVASRLQEAE